MLPEFRNEPLTDFNDPRNVEAFAKAIEDVRSQLGQRYPLVINGQEVWTDETFDSINPARPDEVVGTFAKGTAELADRAVRAAHEAYLEWQHTPAFERAGYLLRAAGEMRRRKHEFSAWMVFEVGKSWVEADADTAEAIDFLEYYARQMMRLDRAGDLLTPRHDEHADLRYIALGVGIVIPPWNFPNAIMTGMTSAALVSGNSVVQKPASTSPTIAYKLCELFWQQGIPAGVLNFLPGPGGVVGDTLVDHPLTRFIAFTGSKEVGLRIFERAAKQQPGQIWLKRTILEMGGKDAVVVDETADPELAAINIVASAFGFQGQKCSAGSRAIITAPLYDEIVERVVSLTRQLTVGETDKGKDVYMGPVIDKKAFDSIMDYIRIGRENHPLLSGGEAIETDTNGYFIQPTIFGDVPSDAVIAQEEIFGPVLAMMPAKDFDDALRIFNSTEYGLTGSLFSNDRRRIERARREFHVGNLYINRKCTGALVGVHPFGGFNMSGTDSKAGGPDYLLLFTQAKSISEKLF
ncbi:MAG: L-glutamate gamma-semialdehyde dehydrogenase [Phototrophicales bacterium]|nr:MAG: L-glutamate gamma-semialdehyde dehydrogenase [Phototrophicales bacterium]